MVWLQRKPMVREQADSQLTLIIQSIFAKSRATLGRRRLGRLMRAAGLACKTRRKFKATTDSKHNLLVADNLLDRQFTVQKPNQVYVSDITYIHTREGWLYLTVVIDLYSRQAVGWPMDGNMRAKLVNDALLMAIWKRKPDKGLLWHTERGSQYASDSHRELLEQHGIQQSMSRKVNCWERLPLGYNAGSESFFHALKTELIHHQTFHFREDAKQAVFE